MPPRRKSSPVRFETPELDRAIAAAEADAIVVWRGEPLPFLQVPERLARTDDRDERDRLLGAWLEGVEALNPRYEERLEAWRSMGDAVQTRADAGLDPRSLAVDLERFVILSETPYYAALRRYLALIDIEQGDGTIADMWHVRRGAAWSHWFTDREVRRAVAAVGRAAVDASLLDGWRAAEASLSGDGAGDAGPVRVAVDAAYASLVGSPEWLSSELGVSGEDVLPFVDFASFVRLSRVRRDIGHLQFELRLFGDATDRGIQRAYYSGIVGHITGVNVPEETYLRVVPRPFQSASDLRVAILAADLVEALEQRHGAAWWRDPASAQLVETFGSAPSVEDALAQLGYDSLDWRPLLRQIRTRLIGEMSGYGGPNITTRAGTRKV